MHQETVYKLHMGEGYDTSGFPRLFPSGRKRNFRLIHRQNPAVGNGNPVGILSKVFQGIAETVERLFDIRAPVLLIEGILKILPSAVRSQTGQGRRKGKAAVTEKGIQQGKELSFKFVPEDMDRNEKFIGTPAYPMAAGQASAGNNTMHMHMVTQFLIPCMKYLDYAGDCPEELGIGGKFQKGPGTAFVEECV